MGQITWGFHQNSSDFHLPSCSTHFLWAFSNRWPPTHRGTPAASAGSGDSPRWPRHWWMSFMGTTSCLSWRWGEQFFYLGRVLVFVFIVFFMPHNSVFFFFWGGSTVFFFFFFWGGVGGFGCGSCCGCVDLMLLLMIQTGLVEFAAGIRQHDIMSCHVSKQRLAGPSSCQRTMAVFGLLNIMQHRSCVVWVATTGWSNLSTR